LNETPLFSGQIQSTGPRYCPSVELKVVRFPDKDRHQVFLEPEGRNTNEIYCNGLATSIPREMQAEMVHSIEGLEDAVITQYGYAVEYDYCDPLQIEPTMESKVVEGLYLAGQINGTSGYEEAAGQGIVAGINAALKRAGKRELVLGRNEAYIGVLIDDLVTKGVDEPYRMFTGRAEYRLLLRSDNAESRLMGYGHECGLLDEATWGAFLESEARCERACEYLEKTRREGKTLAELLRNPKMSLAGLMEMDEGFGQLGLTESERRRVETEVKYVGYIRRQLAEAARFKEAEASVIPGWVDYERIPQLRAEARQKLSRVRPKSLGQASRISGIGPAELSVLMVYLKGKRSNRG